MTDYNAICIIPARGGSKRIPRKNLALVNGKPMIAWPVSTAINSGLFSRIVVSTDDAEIAETARQLGAEIPFMREAGLADDFATTADVLVDALQRCPGTEFACCIYPTALMLEVRDLEKAEALLTDNRADCVLGVTEFDYQPLRALERNKDGRLSFKWPQYELSRSQDLPELVHDAGMFYFFRVEHLLKTGSLLGGITLGVSLPRSRAVDIDTPDDLELAAVLHHQGLGEGSGKA